MTYVELQFPFTGKTLPSNHGYGLYGAISRVIPEAHSADWLAVETIPGAARGDGVTQLDPQAKLKIRIPQDHVTLILKLAGKRLEVDGHAIRLGAPQIYLLKPATALYARIVTIKGFTEPEPFLDAVCRKLDELGVKGEPVVGPRRVVRVGDHKVVGFALAIHELSDEGSIILQERGLGGRRKQGGGFFKPITLLRNDKARSESLQTVTPLYSYRLSASVLSGRNNLQISLLLNTLRTNKRGRINTQSGVVQIMLDANLNLA